MNCGEKISRLRKSKGMTQAELGKVLNVTYQAVSKWERGESLPDFNMMSQIAALFEVPIGYFEEGGENEPTLLKATADTEEMTVAPAANNIAGVCTECGKMLKEEEVYETTPKLVCKNCVEASVSSLKRDSARSAKEQLGRGVDIKLIVSFVLALFGYAVLTVLCFVFDDDDEVIAAFMIFVPPMIFAIVLVIFEFINDLKDKENGRGGYKLIWSIVFGVIFAAVNVTVYLILSLCFDRFGYYLVLLVIGAVSSFTFVSQYMWGGVVREIFTCGGFTLKLPGVIFSLTPESVILMILIKLFLGILAIAIFLATTVFFAVNTILGSVILFIPCIISKAIKDSKAKAELNKANE